MTSSPAHTQMLREMKGEQEREREREREQEREQEDVDEDLIFLIWLAGAFPSCFCT